MVVKKGAGNALLLQTRARSPNSVVGYRVYKRGGYGHAKNELDFDSGVLVLSTKVSSDER